MINPLVLWGAAGALFAGFFAGWSVRDWKADADTLAAYERADQLREKMQAKVDAASSDFEAWRIGADSRSIETRNTIREIYRDVEVPADCAVPVAGVGLLRARVAGANAAAAGKLGTELQDAAAPADQND